MNNISAADHKGSTVLNYAVFIGSLADVFQSAGKFVRDELEPVEISGEVFTELKPTEDGDFVLSLYWD